MLDSCLQAGGDRWANDYDWQIRYGKTRCFKLDRYWLNRLPHVFCQGSLERVGMHLLVQKPQLVWLRNGTDAKTC